MKYILLILIITNFFCNTLDKERLELDRQILEFEKAKFQKCGCCNPGEEKPTVLLYKKPEAVDVPKKDCNPVSTAGHAEIWNLAEEGNWYYSPNQMSKGELCKEEPMESFYKIYSNTESYVAETQVPKTKKSSCINNVLFHGKDKLYQLMLEKTAKEELKTELPSFANVKKETIEYNNAEKGRSFYYECKPTDPQKKWDKCTCLLYASYGGGKEKLAERLKKEIGK